jgi:transcriptional regulator with XRE-family HTH domain
MSTRAKTAPLSYDERVEERLVRLSEAIPDRIRALKGDTLQRELAEQVGKSSSTVSNHLSGGVNLTLRTIAEYEGALDGEVVQVPQLERPKRRRRRSASGTRRVSDQRRALNDIDPATRRLHRLLTDVSARIGQVLDAREDLTQQALAERMGKDASYVSRVLGGGVNLTLKTIAQFEEALGDRVICVVDPLHRGQAKGQFSVYASMRPSSDGGHYVDVPRAVTGAVTGYLERKQQEEGQAQQNLDEMEPLSQAA